MGLYSIELDYITEWASRRASELSPAWYDAVYAHIKASPWKFEVEVLIDDALNAHARAERWAYMRGEPVPCADRALKAMMKRLRALERDDNKFNGELPDIKMDEAA